MSWKLASDLLSLKEFYEKQVNLAVCQLLTLMNEMDFIIHVFLLIQVVECSQHSIDKKGASL